MDSLLMQMRAKYPRARPHNREEQGSSREINLPPQKSQSFKEKKTAGRWLREQFSRQMSGDNELSDDGILEHVAAVAAAVFAVHSVNEDQSEIATRKINSDRRDRETSSSAKIKYIKDDDTRPLAPRPAPDPSKVSRRPSNPGEGSDGKQKQKPTDQKLTDPSSSLSMRKTPTFSDNKPDIISGSRKFSEPQKPAVLPTPTRIPTSRPPTPTPTPRPPTPPISRKPSNSTGPPETKETNPSNPTQTKADFWEKAEMAKIRNKSEKVNETISYWETKKREKAMRKLEESQAVGVKRRKREKGRKKFEEDMEFIKQIAAEARAKAEEKRRNDTLKVKQKADVLRETGDLPVTCYCC
ncbi:remorin 4.1-like isoform X2 [Momordica charantia]|uniref:Remorin 4.1-like isoform X2 n=1 Tax=Momordica charantia TaxID=3673 RepID=A0A6J1DX13_MOMCH|nr:remorin 4.1-like isoform X2 [Momordica charantia]XP_022157121.1 remorin 4.1-like isoform X2 [Momordica charantia]